MQIHQLKNKNRKKKKRIGRGGKKGTYSGRGIKGQKARAGNKLKPMIRELIKKYHKLRGYRTSAKDKKERIINLSDLENNFKKGERITPRILLNKKIIRKINNKVPKVKILGQGDLKKDLIIEGCRISKSAREKIKKAGGEVKI